jgi:hypothetical protein
LAKYASLRRTQRRINNQLVQRLAKATVVEGARRLGLWHRGKLMLSSERVMDVLTDFIIYDCCQGGRNAIARYRAATDFALGSEEAAVLEAMAQTPPLSLFRVKAVTREVGIEAQDLLTDEVAFVTDLALGKSAEAGLCLATRLLRFPHVDVNMTSGAPVAVDEVVSEGLAADIHAEIGSDATKVLATMDAEERSRLAARILREVLAV